MTLGQIVANNLEGLKQNKYPGRGIIIGQTEDGQNYVQIYWLTKIAT